MSRNLTQIASACAACGQCRSVCPAFSVSGNREPESPRARIMLARGLHRGDLIATRGSMEMLSGCLLCNSCVSECPSGVPVDQVILESRRWQASLSGLPPLKRLVNAVFGRPALVAVAARAGSLLMPLLGRSWPPRWWPSSARRAIPRPAPRPLSATFIPTRKPDFLFFRGCLVEHLMPAVGTALIGLARANNLEPGLVGGEVCCGIPLLASGDLDGYHRLAATNLKLLAGDLPVVTACATCTAVLKKYYVQNPPPGLEAEAKSTADRVVDAVQLLHTWDLRELELGGKWTYHQPCHHHKGHHWQVDGGPAMQRLLGDSYLEAGDPDGCCGFGGSYSLDHHHRAAAIADDRVAALLASGATGIATACPGCLMHLEAAMARRGGEAPVCHIVQLAWEAAGRPGPVRRTTV